MRKTQLNRACDKCIISGPYGAFFIDDFKLHTYYAIQDTINALIQDTINALKPFPWREGAFNERISSNTSPAITDAPAPSMNDDVCVCGQHTIKAFVCAVHTISI